MGNLNSYDYGNETSKMHEYLGLHALAFDGAEDISEGRVERKAFKFHCVASTNPQLAQRIAAGGPVEMSAVCKEDDPKYKNKYYYRKLRSIIASIYAVDPAAPESEFDFEAALGDLEGGAHAGTYLQAEVFTKQKKTAEGKLRPGEMMTDIRWSPAPNAQPLPKPMPRTASQYQPQTWPPQAPGYGPPVGVPPQGYAPAQTPQQGWPAQMPAQQTQYGPAPAGWPPRSR